MEDDSQMRGCPKWFFKWINLWLWVDFSMVSPGSLKPFFHDHRTSVILFALHGSLKKTPLKHNLLQQWHLLACWEHQTNSWKSCWCPTEAPVIIDIEFGYELLTHHQFVRENNANSRVSVCSFFFFKASTTLRTHNELKLGSVVKA